ncbi:MAG: FAD-dependent oxidoreductase [Bacteroidota bacterium]
MSKSKLLSDLLQPLKYVISLSENDLKADELFEKYTIDRRDFLLQSLKLASVGGIVSACAPEQILAPKDRISAKNLKKGAKNQPNITIIGAGISGLYAAYTLQNAGYNTTIYEASQRTGGRMYTVPNLLNQGQYTEVGGEFIDSIHKDIIKLARELGLELLDTKPLPQSTLQYQAYYFGGVHYTEAEVIEAFLPFAKKIKQDQAGMSNLITADSHSSYDELLDNMSIAQYFDKIGLSGWLRDLLDVAYVTEFGQPIAEQTALNFLWMISPKVANGTFQIFGVSDERYKIKGGNQLIPDRLVERLEAEIKLGHELKLIDKNGDGSYQLKIKNGQNILDVQTDILIVTIPFTVLRNIPINAELPAWKIKAIQELGYGNNSKMMLGFNTRYWHQLGYSGYYFTESFLQSGWDNSELQDGNAGSLTCYSGANQALIVGNGSIEEQAQIHLAELENMYPGATAAYNGKASRFVWPTHPHTLSSYGCFKPGQYTSIAGNEIKPVDNMYFAGEHCSYDFQGYMNGGAETGRRVAEWIITALKSKA